MAGTCSVALRKPRNKAMRRPGELSGRQVALAAVDVRQAAARSHTAAHLAKRTLTSRTALERRRSKAPVPFLPGLTHAATVAARTRSARS